MLPNAARACSEAAYALKRVARMCSKATKALKTLVETSTFTAFLIKYVSNQLEFRMLVEELLERVFGNPGLMCCSKLLFEITSLCNTELTLTPHSSSYKVHGMHGITLIYIYIYCSSIHMHLLLCVCCLFGDPLHDVFGFVHDTRSKNNKNRGCRGVFEVGGTTTCIQQILILHM